MKNEYTSTKKGRVQAVDALANGHRDGRAGNRNNMAGQGTQGRNSTKRSGNFELSNRKDERQFGVKSGMESAFSGSATIQGGNIPPKFITAAHAKTIEKIRLFDWQSVVLSLAIFWAVVSNMAGCEQQPVYQYVEPDTTVVAISPGIEQIRSALDSGMIELKTAARRFDSAAATLGTKKIIIEVPHMLRDSIQ